MTNSLFFRDLAKAAVEGEGKNRAFNMGTLEMVKRTIYISEDDTVAEILECCPLAARTFENYFGRDFLQREDLDKISLGAAVGLYHRQLHPILIELNRICL